MKDKAFTHANDDVPARDGVLNYDQRWEIIQAARREQAEVFAALVGRGSRNVVRFLNQTIFAPLTNIVRYAREAAVLARLSDHELADIGLSRLDVTGQIFSTGVGGCTGDAMSNRAAFNAELGAHPETAKRDLAA